jgi:hypothetical protein
VLWAALLAAAWPRAEATAADPPAVTPLDLKLLTSRSGRFVVVGPVALDNLAVAAWADALAARVERTVGIPLPFDRRRIRIALRTWEQPPEGLEGPGVTQEAEGDRILQRLILYDPAAIRAPAARDALVRLLLSGYLWECVPAAGWPRDAAVAPRWLAAGLAGYLDPDERAARSLSVLEDWQDGLLPSLSRWLNDPAGEPPPQPAMSTLFVSLLLRFEAPAPVLPRLFAQLAAGGRPDPAWVADALGLEGPGALEEAWDAWVLRQQRVIYRPGSTTEPALERLRAELLLYPGDCGIPISVELPAGAGLWALLPHADAAWVPAFCRAKLADLQMAAVGRDAGFRDVVQRYAAFLEALADGARESRLRERLHAADEAMKQLEQQQAAQTAVEGR